MIMGRYVVYIITNKHKTVLYTGVTNNLTRRLIEHDENIRLGKKTFASKYKCKHLLYFEKYNRAQEAITREKQIKGWVRSRKLELIKTTNSKLDFLEEFFLL